MSEIILAKTIASVSICLLGGFSEWLTDGNTGMGWAILGLLFIWG